jgi:predicted NBD/HSP70 family sugar kinase
VIAAFDIGGTHVAAARVDPRSARVVEESRSRSALPPAGSREQLVNHLVGAARAVAGGGIDACGVAVPGPFDYERGVSKISHKLAALYDVDLRHELAGPLGLDARAVHFLNDAEAFLLGEWWAGAARGHPRAVGVTLGTGIGSAFLVDGRIVDSGPGVPAGGELYLLSFRGAPVEERLSRLGLLTRYGEPGLDVEQIAERARRGESRARTTFAVFASDLGALLAPWLAAFGATCLVVGGSIARAWELLEPTLRPPLASLPRLRLVAVAANLDDAALLGAALHAAATER